MTAVATHTCKLKVGGTTVGDVTSMSISLSRGSIDVTAINAAADAAKKYIPSALYDAGEISCDLHYDKQDGGQLLLLDSLEDGTSGGTVAFVFEVLDSSGATVDYEFNGFVTSWEVTAAVDDTTKASVTIKLTQGGVDGIPGT